MLDLGLSLLQVLLLWASVAFAGDLPLLDRPRETSPPLKISHSYGQQPGFVSVLQRQLSPLLSKPHRGRPDLDHGSPIRSWHRS